MSGTTFVRGEDPLRADKLNTAFSERVSRAGDTMTGVLTLAVDPSNPFDAATKQYVDRFTSLGVPTGAYIGASPPGNTLAPLWWNSDDGQLYIQYDDGNSVQWVSASSTSAETFGFVSEAPIDGTIYGRKDAGWVNVLGSASYLPLSGGTMTGPLNLTATLSTTARSVQDRFGEVVNVNDYGANIGSGPSDAAGIGAALSVLKPHQAIYFPAGTSSFLWGGVQGTTPTTPVFFKVDGTTSGGSPILRAFARSHKGDVFETFYNGIKYLSKRDPEVASTGVLSIEHLNDSTPGGVADDVCIPLRVTLRDNVDATRTLWGAHIALDAYGQNTPISGVSWPQHVGISASVIRRAGSAWMTGMHVTASDFTNASSSGTAALIGMEIGHHANGDDDGGPGNSPGQRMGIHLGFSAQIAAVDGGVLPAVQGMGYNFSGTTNDDAITVSIFGVTTVRTYQVFDARAAVAPASYGQPVAALRMVANQIIDFNGAAPTTRANWKAGPGAYLQYRAATNRLYYVVSGVDKFSIDTSGNVRAAGTITASTTP